MHRQNRWDDNNPVSWWWKNCHMKCQLSIDNMVNSHWTKGSNKHGTGDSLLSVILFHLPSIPAENYNDMWLWRLFCFFINTFDYPSETSDGWWERKRQLLFSVLEKNGQVCISFDGMRLWKGEIGYNPIQSENKWNSGFTPCSLGHPWTSMW